MSEKYRKAIADKEQLFRRIAGTDSNPDYAKAMKLAADHMADILNAPAPVVKDDAPFVVAPAAPELVATMQAAQDALMSPAAPSPTAPNARFRVSNPDGSPAPGYEVTLTSPTASDEADDMMGAHAAQGALNDMLAAAPTASREGELLPCPFCGGQAGYYKHHKPLPDQDADLDRTVHCINEKCDAMGQIVDKRTWDRRAALSTPPAEAVEAAIALESDADALKDGIHAWANSEDGPPGLVDEDACFVVETDLNGRSMSVTQARRAERIYRLAAHSLRSQRGVSDGLLLAAKYDELLFAVGMKHPNETRHETALRYIRQAENSPHAPEAALKREGVMRACYLCGSTTKELRPYGAKGQDICHPCMKDTPEREAEAKQQFYAQLDACGAVAVIGTDVGPHPVEHSVVRPTQAKGEK